MDLIFLNWVKMKAWLCIQKKVDFLSLQSPLVRSLLFNCSIKPLGWSNEWQVTSQSVNLPGLVTFSASTSTSLTSELEKRLRPLETPRTKKRRTAVIDAFIVVLRLNEI